MAACHQVVNTMNIDPSTRIKRHHCPVIENGKNADSTNPCKLAKYRPPEEFLDGNNNELPERKPLLPEEETHKKRKELYHEIFFRVFVYTTWLKIIQGIKEDTKESPRARRQLLRNLRLLTSKLDQVVEIAGTFLKCVKNCYDVTEIEGHRNDFTRAVQAKENKIVELKKIVNGAVHLSTVGGQLCVDSWSAVGPFLCFILGLRADFLSEIESSEMLEDMLPMEWVLVSLQSKFASLQGEDKLELSIDVLKELGFTEEGAASLMEAVPPPGERDHLTTIDWVQNYIENQFTYHVLLSEYCLKRYPFNETTISTWFTLTRDQCRKLECNSSHASEVQMINIASKTDESYRFQGGESFPECLEDGQHRVLFHATDHLEAESIVKFGIDISEANVSQFCFKGSGFHLFISMAAARHYRGQRSVVPGRQAVLVYQVGTGVLSEGLDLRDQKEKWKKVCRYHLRSKKVDHRELDGDLLREIDESCYIEGPLVNKVRSSPNKFEHIVPDRFRGDEVNMICIRSDETASALNECLHSVLFF